MLGGNVDESKWGGALGVGSDWRWWNVTKRASRDVCEIPCRGT